VVVEEAPQVDVISEETPVEAVVETEAEAVVETPAEAPATEEAAE
jgi:hypothetical protein